MSLTSELDDSQSWIRRYFEANLPGVAHVAKDVRGELRATPEFASLAGAIKPMPDFGFVGTAFEIRVGAAHRLIDWETCLSTRGFQIAESASPKRLARTVLRPAFTEATRLLATCPPGRRATPRLEGQLCSAALFLARLEHLVRVNDLQASMLLERANSIVDGRHGWHDIPDAWVQDLDQVAATHFRLRGPTCRIRRTARRGLSPALALLVGGADVDLVDRGVLIEFKTTRRVDPVLADLRQVVGYLLLDDDDALGVVGVELEYVRFGKILRFDAEELVRRVTGLPRVSLEEARRAFGAAARQATKGSA